MFCLTCRKRSIEGWIRLYGEYYVTCNICTERYNHNSDIKIGVMIGCGHFFCTVCLDNWLARTWSDLSSSLEPLDDYSDDQRVINRSIFDQDMISNLFLPISDANDINYSPYSRNVLMRLIFSFATYLNQESLIHIIHLIEHYYYQEVTNVSQTLPLSVEESNNEESNNEENIDVIRNDSIETLHTLINEYNPPIINAEIEIPSQLTHDETETDSEPDTVLPNTVIDNDNTTATVNRRRLRRFRVIHLDTHPDIALDYATFVQQLIGNQTSTQTCFTIERSRTFWTPGFFKNTVPHNRNCAFCNKSSNSWIRHTNNVIWIPCCRRPVNNYWF